MGHISTKMADYLNENNDLKNQLKNMPEIQSMNEKLTKENEEHKTKMNSQIITHFSKVSRSCSSKPWNNSSVLQQPSTQYTGQSSIMEELGSHFQCGESCLCNAANSPADLA